MVDISVVMPAFNAEKHIEEAVSSILDQTFENFELLIINDGSTDRTGQLIDSFTDDRIVPVHNSCNIGVSAALNSALKGVNSKYIVRMDADDIAAPERLEKQFKFMESNPALGISGSWVTIFGDQPKSVERTPVGAETLRVYLLFDNPIFHPTVIMRRSLIRDFDLGYDATFSCTEDFDLWSRASRCFPLDNIPESLVEMRHHQGSVTNKRNRVMTEQTELLLARELSQFGITVDHSAAEFHHRVSRGYRCKTRELVDKSMDWLLMLRAQNLKSGCYDQGAFDSVLNMIWFRLCRNSTPLGLWIWKKYRSMDVNSEFSPPVNEVLRCWLSVFYHLLRRNKCKQ